MRYKLWLHLEEADDEADHYQDISEPICIGDFDHADEGTERLYALGLLFGGLMDTEHLMFHRPVFHDAMRELDP